MRMLLPRPLDDVDPLTLYGGAERRAPQGGPWVLVNMIASLDGATSVDGVSGALGGSADRAVFEAIRSVPDMILVGSGTARSEGYRSPRTADANVAARIERGQRPHPRLALVSGSLALDPQAAMFADAIERPLVFTSRAADPALRRRLESVAEVVTAGEERVDPSLCVAALAERGAAIVLCEGGPTLNGQLVAADLVDEWCMTVSPLMVSGTSARAAHGAPSAGHRYALEHVLEDAGSLLLRYLRDR